MAPHPSPEQLGPASLKVGGLEIWVHGREFPEAQYSDDGNWLRISAHCGAPGSSVWTGGTILSLSELAAWRSQCEQLHGGQVDRAALKTGEPELCAVIERIEGQEALRLRVEIALEGQAHSAEFDLEPSALVQIIQQCAAIEVNYPIRGAETG